MQQFKGFKPEAMQRIAGTLGYQGDMSNFSDYLNQNPDKMQQMGMYQQKALQMVNGGMVRKFANGGAVDYSQYYDDKGVLTNADGTAVTPVATPFETIETASPTPTPTPVTPVVAPAPVTPAAPAPITPVATKQPVTPAAPAPVEPMPVTELAKEPTGVAAVLVNKYGYNWVNGEAVDPNTGKVYTPPTTDPRDAPAPVAPVATKPKISEQIDASGVKTYTYGDKSGLTPGEFLALYNSKDGATPATPVVEPTTPATPATPVVEPDITPEPVTPAVPIEMPTLPKLDFTSLDLSSLLSPSIQDGDVQKVLSSPSSFKNPTGFTLKKEDGYWHMIYTDGTKISTEHSIENLAKAAGDKFASAIIALKETDQLKPYVEQLAQYDIDAEAYKKYIGKTTTDDAASTIANIEVKYNEATALLDQNKMELSTLQKLVADNPDNTFYADLLAEKVEELADNVEGVAALEGTYQDTQKTIKDVTVDRFNDPSQFINEEIGTKAVAAKTTISDSQDITSGTGQLDSVAQGQLSKGTATDADSADAAIANIFAGEQVTATAEEKLKNLTAQTQDDLSREVTGQESTIRAEGQADDAIKVAAGRIERAVNPTDLEVTIKQLAEAKGKDLKAIEANISVSDKLKKIVAQTSVVDPKELPPPAKISDSIMRSVQAMKETDTGLSGETTEYIAAKMEAFTVSSGTLAVAMQGDVTAQATVQGQLSSLMKSFDNGTPAWAAGAIRAANEAMLSRGMAASSMAAAAIVQAAMESALPIASQDAQVYAAMGMANLDNLQKVSLANAAAQQGLSLQNLNNEQQMNLQNSVQAFDLQKQNLSNRQSVELANAQIRSMLQGKVLDNTQQSNIITAARYAEQANINLSNKQQAVLQDNVGSLQTNLADASAKQQSYITSANLAQALQGQVLSNDQQVAINTAARYSDAANLNFTSDQQEVLHNSSLMQSIGLAELNTAQAATLQNAANFASMDMAELSNAQQAQVLNAQNFLQLDLANLSNEQQVALFKAQAVQQTLLSDQASINASKQFNATSENQVDQFNVNLKTQVNQFNQAQQTAISQFNAGQANAMQQFNASQANAADQFNAQNEVVIAQSNAVWRREVATAETAAQNRVNEINAKGALDMQAQAYDNMWQRESDMMDNAHKAEEREKDRVNNLAIATLQADTSTANAQAATDASNAAALGSLAVTVMTGGDGFTGLLG